MACGMVDDLYLVAGGVNDLNGELDWCPSQCN